MNEAHLLQSVLVNKHRSEEMTPETLRLQLNKVHIIYSLFMINPKRNSNESVLVSILGMHSGSVGPADRLLTEILIRIDVERSLNILSSPDTWNAFRNNWSRFHVEGISSSLESPFALIDLDGMRQNTLNFNIEVGTTKVESGIDTSKFQILPEKILGSYTIYDPTFWLPVISYCLKKVVHSSELTLLIDNSAVPYALVCLSAKEESIRRMAGHVLVNWEHECEVPLHLNFLLTVGIQFTRAKSDKGTHERYTQFRRGREWHF